VELEKNEVPTGTQAGPLSLPATMSTGPAPEPLLTFPPFPPIAEGHKLIPFKDFKPSGIQMFPGEGEGEIELDGLGIPTVELRVKHDADEPKTGKRKGKKKKKIIETVDGEPVRRLTWWEEWEEGEDLRVSNFGYSSYVFYMHMCFQFVLSDKAARRT
jgi:hypothetical protein